MKKEQSLSIFDRQVRKSNDLIQHARFSLNTVQQKIILHLISQIQPWDQEFQSYDFNVLDFCRICGIDNDSGRNYTEIKEEIKKLSDKSYWLTLEDGDSEVLVRWIECAVFRKNSGIIRLRFNEYLKPYLLQLKEKYTEYQLIYTLHFKSKYSIRLYELICSVHFHDLYEYKRTFALDKLKKHLDCEKYTDYRDFRRDVLEKAIKEINRYSDKTVTYEPITVGRKVVEIELTITTKDAKDRIAIEMEIEKELGITGTFPVRHL